MRSVGGTQNVYFLGRRQSRSPSMPVRRLRVGIALEKSN